MTAQINELEKVAQDTNDSALTVTDPIKLELMEVFKPIATRLEAYENQASSITIKTEEDAQECATQEAAIQADLKVVKENETLTRITDGLHKLHRRWTGFRSEFDKSLTASKKAFRTKRIAWEDEQAKLAAAEEKRLQAIVDEKARKERERQEEIARKQREKEEAARKAEDESIRLAKEATNEEERKKHQADAEKRRKEASAAAAKAEEREDKADSVVSTQVRVSAPARTGGRRKAWKVTGVDPAAFFAALATRPDLQGFVEIKNTNLERAKAANPMMTVDGITFEQKVS